MATPIINSQMDAINESFEKISSDLTTIRPLLKNASIGAYPTDSASGSIASFTDGADDIPVKELKVNLEPIQNLNGYDKPWPAGGGKNLIGLNTSPDAAITYNNISASNHTDDSVKLTSANAAYASMNLRYTLKAGTYTLKYQATSSDSFTPAVSVYKVSGSVLLVNSAPPNTARSFTLDEETAIRIQFFATLGTAAARTVTYSQFQLESGSTATAYAPYSNICPISGHTEVNVTRTGANLIGGDLIVNGYHYNSNGVVEANASRMLSKPVKCSGETAITVAWDETTVSNAIRCIWDANGNLLNRAVPSATVSGSRKYYTTNLNAYPTADTIGFAWYANSGTAQNAVSNISLKYGTDYAYEPYAGQTYPISLGQTVYGGTLNVTTGVLTVDRAMVDLGTLAWFYNSTNLFFIATIADMENKYNYASDVTDVIMSIAKYKGAGVGWANMANGDFGINAKDIRLKLTDYTSTAALVAAITGQQLVYPLATPTTVQLTPSQVSTLLGANNIFADAGTVEVTYRADTGLYIDKKLAQALNA